MSRARILLSILISFLIKITWWTCWWPMAPRTILKARKSRSRSPCSWINLDIKNVIIIRIISRWFAWERWKDLFILWYHFNVEDISHFHIMLSDKHHDDEVYHPDNQSSWSWSWHHPRVSPAPMASSAVHVISVGCSLFVRIPDKNINY